PRPLPHPPGGRRRDGPLPRPPRGRGRPRAEAPHHRAHVHRGVRGRDPARDRAPREAAEVPRAGHALPGRHRERLLPRPERDDQDAPQRGRAARGAGVRPHRAVPRAVQGRGARGGPAARRPGRDHRAAPVPRPRPRRAPPRPRHPRGPRAPPPGRPHLHRRPPRGRPLRRRAAGLRRAAARPERRRDGGLPDVRAGRLPPRRDERGRHDGRLGAPPARLPRSRLEPDHQRGPRHQPRRLRRLLEAARHHRVGVRGDGSQTTDDGRASIFPTPIVRRTEVSAPMLAPRLFFLLALLVLTPLARSQPPTAARVPAAETAFENGLQAYVEGAYEEALRLFARAAGEFGYNARTTAALVMAGKSAYAAGDFGRAVATLDEFLRRYPNSRYVPEAERVRALAREGGPGGP